MIKSRCNMTFLIMWHHWHWCGHHMIQMPLSVGSLHSLGQEIEMGCNITIIMWDHWCWHHVMLTLSSITPLHSLGQDDQNEVQHDSLDEVQHDSLDHITPLAPVSLACDADGIISSTIAFLRSRWLKWDATWLFWLCNNISACTGITWWQWCHQCNIAFLSSWQWKCDVTWLFCY